MSAARVSRASAFFAVIPAKAGQARSAQNIRRMAPKGRAKRVIQCLRFRYPQSLDDSLRSPLRVGAHWRAMLSGRSEELSCAFGARVTFLLLGQEKSNQKRRPPRLVLAGHPARQVRESRPGFSTAHPCAGEKESASCRLPLRGLSTPTHRRTGAPGRAAGHRGPHSWRSLRERTARSRVAPTPRLSLTPHSSPLTPQARAQPAATVITLSRISHHG